MTIRDVSFSEASANLAVMLTRGDTLTLVRRGPSRRHNLIVDVAVQHISIGRFVGAIVGRPYLFTQQGVLLRGGLSAEEMVKRVSVELFGEPNQLKAVWL